MDDPIDDDAASTDLTDSATPASAGGRSNAARGASTLSETLGELSGLGFDGEFSVAGDGGISRPASIDALRCHRCRAEFAASEGTVDRIERLEGVSDPDDMLAVVAMRCPRCGAAGTLVLNYGPESTPEQAAVLASLPDPATR
jgi:hypothetical protein